MLSHRRAAASTRPAGDGHRLSARADRLLGGRQRLRGEPVQFGHRLQHGQRGLLDQRPQPGVERRVLPGRGGSARRSRSARPRGRGRAARRARAGRAGRHRARCPPGVSATATGRSSAAASTPTQSSEATAPPVARTSVTAKPSAANESRTSASCWQTPSTRGPHQVRAAVLAAQPEVGAAQPGPPPRGPLAEQVGQAEQAVAAGRRALGLDQQGGVALVGVLALGARAARNRPAKLCAGPAHHRAGVVDRAADRPAVLGQRVAEQPAGLVGGRAGRRSCATRRWCPARRPRPRPGWRRRRGWPAARRPRR